MKFYLLTISSKNEKSLNKFISFLLKILKHYNLIKISKKKNKKHIVTILKSPHVNKTAQEQFETRIFSKHIYIFINYNFNKYIYLKKIIKKSFHDIKLTIKYLIENKYSKKKQFKILNIKNFKLCNEKKTYSILKNKKLKYFLELTNILGEILINSKKTIKSE